MAFWENLFSLEDNQHITLHIAISILFTFVIMVGLVVVLAHYWPLGPDYYFVFRPITKLFLQADTRLYDQNSLGFYNPPWAIWLFIPTVFLPLNYGQALLLTASLAGLMFAVWVVDRHNKLFWLVKGLAVANLHTFDLLIRGNVDGFVVLGVGLGWLGIEKRKPWLLGIGIWFLSLKPMNVILVILVFIKLVRKWSLNEKIQTALPLTFSLGISFFILGFDWPVRYVEMVGQNPPLMYLQTSFWRMLAFLGIERIWALVLFGVVVIGFGILVWWLPQVDQRILALAIAMNLVFSPYTLGSHYVLLAPVFVILGKEHKRFALLWFLTLTPLLRLWWGFAWAWVDIVYPTALMLAAGYIVVKQYTFEKDVIERWALFQK